VGAVFVRTFRTLLLGGIAALSTGGAAGAQHILASHREHVLGTSLDLTIAGGDSDTRHRAEAAALDEIGRLDRVLSAWRSDSELTALNHSSVFHASEDLYAVVAFAERMRLMSEGAFDARLGAVRDAWTQATQSNTPPSEMALADMVHTARREDVTLDPVRRLIFRPSAVKFDLDGLAKGYVIDRAIAAARLAAPEARGIMLDIGGDIGAWGQGLSDAWRIGVAAPDSADNHLPASVVSISDSAIATSGPGARDIIVGGAPFAHFVDAASGASVYGAHATVAAPSAMQADALSTALALMSPQAGLELINSAPDAAARIVSVDGKIYESILWRGINVDTSAPCQADPSATARAWPPSFALNIGYDIPRFDGGDYQRPNVAIWISDGGSRLVRTLLVLGDKPRWRESNYIWWRRFERMNLDAVQAMARPTRAPGHYTLIWDGRDDSGHAVPQGHYVLNIEASREHGGHSFTSIPLDLAAAPLTASANAEEEMGAVRIRYGASP
jgi:thiamine biosynthesis lipoprotein